MFDSQSWKSRPDHAVCSVETGLHMIKAIKDVRHNTQVSSKWNRKNFFKKTILTLCKFEAEKFLFLSEEIHQSGSISEFSFPFKNIPCKKIYRKIC